ncbi:MAG: hypothetical protein ACYC56_11455, partial [Candidatus Aquicultor sp.]
MLNRQKRAEATSKTIWIIRSTFIASVLLLGAVVVCGLFLSGCSQTSQATRQHRVVFALFDLSGSTDIERANFADDFKAIVSALDEGDTIIADKIVDDPLSNSSFPINTTLPEFNPSTDNDLVRNKEFDNF